MSDYHLAPGGAPATDASDPLTPAYAGLSSLVLGTEPLSAIMARIADLAVANLPDADDVSVTLVQRGQARTMAFSHNGRLAAALDERQYEAGFGPCLDAAVTGQVITIEDTEHDLTYPDFARQARRHGVTRVLSIGMPTAQDTSGALNIYGTASSGPFDRRSLEIATTFSSFAGIAMVNASLYAGAVTEVAQMHQALASRARIEQAKGIIMAEHHCSADEAFDLLRRLSSTSNRKLREVAETIVETATGERIEQGTTS